MPRTARITTIAVLAGSALLGSGGATALAAGRTTATIKLTPAQPAVGATLTLDGSRSKCAAKPCTYLWTIQAKAGRRAKVSTKAKATLKLTASGSFVVTLKVTDKRRRSATAKRTLAVKPALPVPAPPPPLAAPPAPPTVTLTARTLATPIVATPAEGALLSSPTVTLTGVADAGAQMSVLERGAALATSTAGATGAWRVDLSGVADGTHAYVVRASDGAGNVSADSAARTVRIDTLTPAAPVFVSPADDAPLASSTVTLTGTAEPGSTVALSEGALSHGTAVASPTGAWSKAITALADGRHTFAAKATDAAGHTSAAASRSVRVDTVAPGSPTITTPAPDALLSTASVQLAGTAEAGAAIEIFDGAVSVGKATAAAGGTWEKTVDGLAEGAHTFTVKATDAAGNTSSASVARGVRVDTLAPAAPVLLSPANGAVLGTAFVTVSGTAEPGAVVELFDDKTSLGSVAANSTGEWSKALTGISEGQHSLTARATDAAGHTSLASGARALRVDTVAPDAPAITSPSDDALLAASTVTLSGTVEAGATVELFEGAVSHGTAAGGDDGTWSKAVSGLADGVHAFTVKARDAAGHVSVASAARRMRVDTQAPAAPVITKPDDNVLLATGTVLFTGTGEPGATLKLSVDGDVRTSAFVDPQGDWAAQLHDVSDGTHAVSAVAVDPAGNASPTSARTLRIDTVAPDTTLVSPPPPTVVVNAVEFEFSGGATYECRLDRPGSPPGEWEACTSPARYAGLQEGDHAFRVRAIDEAGNKDVSPAEHAFGVRLQAGGSAQVFVSLDGDDAEACSLQTPCKSLKRAYAAAENDGVIQIAAGVYGDDELPRGEKRVTVRGEPGARPELRFLDVWTDDVTVRRLKVQKLNVRGSRQVYDDIDVDAKFAHRVALEHWDGSNNTFKNGRIGNVTDEKGALVGGHGWTFDNVEFHDVLVTDPLVHNECFYATGAQGLTVRNSTFHDCATMDIFFTNYAGGGPYGNITLENNVFEHTYMETPGTWHYYTMGIHSVVGELNNWVVRNNTFETGVSSGPKKGTGRWVGNLGDWDCIEGVQYRYNVGQACGDLDSGVFPAASTKEKPAAFDWVDPGKRDFRLKPTSPALDNADPVDFPPTDRNGNPRPQGWGPDAGAVESG